MKKNIHENFTLKQNIDGKKGNIPNSTINEYQENKDINKKEFFESMQSFKEKAISDSGDIFTEKDEELSNLNTYVNLNFSYEKSYIENKNEGFSVNLNTNTNLHDTIYGLNLNDYGSLSFQGEYMKEIEGLINETDGTMNGFIEGLNKKGYTEADLLKTMTALSAESFIRTYDNDFYENGNYNSAKEVLSQELNGDQLISNLKTSINMGTHVDTLTCIQYSTIIAQILKKQGYDIVETGTIDIGVQHRFTALKGNDGKTYIISDGQLFSGENYAQAYTNYQAKEKTITFGSDIFDSNNNYKGRFTTDTMKYLGNIVSSNGVLNSQDLSKNISKEGIDIKNKLELEIGNHNKELGFVNINESGFKLYGKIGEKI